jgi:hypothetical protein
LKAIEGPEAIDWAEAEEGKEGLVPEIFFILLFRGMFHETDVKQAKNLAK